MTSPVLTSADCLELCQAKNTLSKEDLLELLIATASSILTLDQRKSKNVTSLRVPASKGLPARSRRVCCKLLGSSCAFGETEALLVRDATESLPAVVHLNESM